MLNTSPVIGAASSANDHRTRRDPDEPRAGSPISPCAQPRLHLERGAHGSKSVVFVGSGTPNAATTASPMNFWTSLHGARRRRASHEVPLEDRVQPLGIVALPEGREPTMSQKSAVTVLRVSPDARRTRGAPPRTARRTSRPRGSRDHRRGRYAPADPTHLPVIPSALIRHKGSSPCNATTGARRGAHPGTRTSIDGHSALSLSGSAWATACPARPLRATAGHGRCVEARRRRRERPLRALAPRKPYGGFPSWWPLAPRGCAHAGSVRRWRVPDEAARPRVAHGATEGIPLCVGVSTARCWLRRSWA